MIFYLNKQELVKDRNEIDQQGAWSCQVINVGTKSIKSWYKMVVDEFSPYKRTTACPTKDFDEVLWDSNYRKIDGTIHRQKC